MRVFIIIISPNNCGKDLFLYLGWFIFNYLRSYSPLSRNNFLVTEAWKYVSNLGSGNSNRLITLRSNVLSNQINFIIGISMAVLGLILLVRMKINNIELGIGIMRVWYTFVLSMINLLLAQFRFNKLSKYSLLFLPPLVFLVIPILMGFVEEEGYTYNAYVLIAASIIPQLLLSSEKEKVLYWIAMTYYLVLILIIDLLVFKFQKNLILAEHIKGSFFIYKLAHLSVFLFLNVTIYYLRKLNYRFEEKLNVKNTILNARNEELKAKNREIIRQKEIIEQNSNDISDSINYASMIQQAVLQPRDFMNEWGIPNFILYKPKAVVSGDFYCGFKKGDSLVIIAADCTGHGVPGAFMSILGLAFLDDIFSNFNSLSAADILNKLREQVINKLTQKNTAVQMKDGMDISVCILNRAEGSLEFSGANNPLYLVRNGTLIKLAADKMPIGIYSQSVMPFSNKTKDLKKGDLIYLFSDGYADQFGGKSGRKMMYKQFQDVLLQNHDKPMEEQKELLDEHFERWKGDYDQVDDVLVIGIKV